MNTLALAVIVTLWHSMQGAEREALEATLARVNKELAPAVEVHALAIPFDAFGRKLETTIPRGHGPDLFVAAHDRLGDWVASGLLAPLEPPAGTAKTLREGLSSGGKCWAIPVGYKALLLYYDRKLLPEGPPLEVAGLTAMARTLPRGVTPLAYDATNFFFHAPFFLAGGGRLFDGDRLAVFDEPRAFATPIALKRAGAIPDEASTALATELFNSGRAAIVLSGPWFAGDIKRPATEWDVAPLFEGHGSFVTVEGLFLAATSAQSEVARDVAGRLAAAWVRPGGRERLERAQEPAMRRGLVTPSRPEMSLVWDPAKTLLMDILERGLDLEVALERGRHSLAVLTQPDPPAANATPYVVIVSGTLVVLSLIAARRASRGRVLERAARPDARFAYALVLPAFTVMLVLVVAPFVAGAVVSLFAARGGELTFVGLQNFAVILTSRDQPIAEPGSFYFILAVTVLWTVANVVLHVSIGVALALLLRRPWLRLRGLYRVLLVLPWAVPSYITALIWKGMFNQQFGAVNALLLALGLEPVSWFSRFSTAFAANVTTNTWLGFPFMMVVTLGALQGIPPELEEVARLEGASRWQTFRLVILPAIRPALAPAVVLGSVWTFNMFNVIYLVSGGEPAGATEILISEAYKWAFVRQHRYGYAAAYAVLIFGILLATSRLTVSKEKE